MFASHIRILDAWIPDNWECPVFACLTTPDITAALLSLLELGSRISFTVIIRYKKLLVCGSKFYIKIFDV
jgi:hypothetical protein